MRILFAGTPQFSVPPLQALLDSPHEVVAVLTQPDRPAGRGRTLQPSAVKTCALNANVPVLQPSSLKETAIQSQLETYHADVMVVVAYGVLLPQTVLDIPKHGCINIHASLLPRWRGAAPIHRAIQAGDKKTGISIMQMDAGLDTGAVLLETPCDILMTDTTGDLHDKLSIQGASALLKTLTMIENHSLVATSQSHDAVNYAHKISKAEARIDWQQSTLNLYNNIRAFNPWPVAHTTFNEINYRIWAASSSHNTLSQQPAGTILQLNGDYLEVATIDGSLRITEIQPAGKKAMKIKDFFKTKHSFKINDCFL